MNEDDSRSMLGSNTLTVASLRQNVAAAPRAKQCPVGMDLAALGKKWTFHILRSVGMSHIDRFNQILRAFPGLTPRVLIMRLNELGSCGLLEPVTIQEKPRLVRWVLTEKGRDAMPIIEAYSAYVSKWYPNASLMNHLAPPKPPTLYEMVETYR